MRRARPLAAAALLAAALICACGSSPAAPSPSPNAPSTAAAPASTATGRVIDALSGAPLSSVTVALDSNSATTAGDGMFQVPAPATGTCSLTASGPGVVQRDTTIRMPAAGLSLSLIPASLDLAAFDEMCRSDGALHRWTAAPALVIIDAVLRFTNVSDAAYTALDERLTPEAREAIAADLAWGLPQVTGGTFSSFASVTVESPAAGASVNVYAREANIVVARFSGLSQATGYWGYGRWARRGNAVVAGAVMLDRDFDIAGTEHTRSLRVHELGHALGYSHVTLRQSFMNSSAVFEPNDFDRDATKVAFQRVPGNQSPDRDPSLSALAQPSGRLVWGPILP